MTGKTVAECAVTMAHALMPDETNPAGTIHGGNMLKHIDNAGSIAAQRHARRTVVTASLERMDFLTPVRPGELMILKASLNLAGTTSMEVGVRVEAEDLFTGDVRHAATCYLTFVALDSDGKPCAVPPLILVTEEDERRYCKALERKKLRKRLQAQATCGM